MNRYALALFLAAGVLAAQESAPAKNAAPAKLLPPRVRTGTIVKAEFSSDKPAAESSSPVSGKSSSAWALISLSLDPGRAAGIFDYVLCKGSSEYPCLDIAENDNTFQGKLRIYSSPESKLCRLVFAIPSAEDEYEIVFKLIAEDGAPVKLNVKPPPPPPPPAEVNKTPDDKKVDSAGGKKDDSAASPAA